MGAEQSEPEAGEIDPNLSIFNIRRYPTRALLHFPPTLRPTAVVTAPVLYVHTKEDQTYSRSFPYHWEDYAVIVLRLTSLPSWGVLLILCGVLCTSTSEWR